VTPAPPTVVIARVRILSLRSDPEGEEPSARGNQAVSNSAGPPGSSRDRSMAGRSRRSHRLGSCPARMPGAVCSSNHQVNHRNRGAGSAPSVMNGVTRPKYPISGYA